MKIHLTGVCGVAMGTLACMLEEKGHEVSGSDEGMYPPMSTILNERKMELHEGFHSDNINGADCVIIGNAISRGNPEAEAVLNRKIPYMSMAGALREFFLKGKTVISVSGTHGKTTTTALLSHILEGAGKSPSFLVGGALNNYGSNYRLGEGEFFVIEGDEYDSAFFEKVPKFIFYRPDHLLVTSLEFDHADIYGSIEELELWFRRLVNIIPSEGHILYSSRYPLLKKAVSGAFSKVHSYGGEGSDFYSKFREYRDKTAMLSLMKGADSALDLESPLFGEFNFDNITAASSMALLLGVQEGDIYEGVKSFQGVKRRQEIIYSDDTCIIYEDFAHHPTAIGLVLGAVRGLYPSSCIHAVYEPRSATSRRNIFQLELPGAFIEADRVYIKSLFKPEKVPERERLDLPAVVNDLKGKGLQAGIYDTVDEIVENVAAGVEGTGKHSVIVIMSNGGFGGIYEKLPLRLKDMKNRDCRP